MGLIFAFVFLAVGILALIAYGGTPHGGPTTSCGPIDFFGHSFTLSADCRYISAGEVALAVVSFLLAVVALLIGRPRTPV